MCEICLKLAIKKPEQHHCSVVFIVDVEQVNSDWVYITCFSVTESENDMKTLFGSQIATLITFKFDRTQTISSSKLLFKETVLP